MQTFWLPFCICGINTQITENNTKMKKIFTFLAFFYLLASATAQQKNSKKTSPDRYIITESKFNEVDNTEFDLGREGFLSFIELCDTGELNLVNSSAINEDFSYGPISKFEFSKSEETKEEYRNDTFEFKWHYYNSYDDVSGYASAKLIRVFKPQGTIFTLVIVLSNLDVIEYSGHVEGTVNFDRLNATNSKL